MRSVPVRSGIRLSTTSTSNKRWPSSRCASRGLPVATTSWPSARSAEARALRILASSSTRRIDPLIFRFYKVLQGSAGFDKVRSTFFKVLRGEWQLNANVGAVARATRHRNRATKPFDDAARDRESEAGASPPRREERIEDPRQIFGLDADPSIADIDADTAGRGLACNDLYRAVSVSRRIAACQHGMPRVGQDVDQREPDPFAVGHDRPDVPVEIHVDGHAWFFASDRAHRILAERVHVDRRAIEFDRPGKIQDLGDDAIEPRHFLVDVGNRRLNLGRVADSLFQRPERR